MPYRSSDGGASEPVLVSAFASACSQNAGHRFVGGTLSDDENEEMACQVGQLGRIAVQTNSNTEPSLQWWGGYCTSTARLSEIFFCQIAGPVMCTDSPLVSTATVTGMSFTSNS